MAAQICERCKHIHDRCYCSPNSTCEKYEPAAKVPLMWKVYRYSINSKEVKATNIFDHWKFDEDVQADLRRCQSKSDFAERLRRNLLYYFWARCEYELVITRRNERIFIAPLYSREEWCVSDLVNDYDWHNFYNWIRSKKIPNKEGWIKIDIYDQIVFNFDAFADYCWRSKG